MPPGPGIELSSAILPPDSRPPVQSEPILNTLGVEVTVEGLPPVTSSLCRETEIGNLEQEITIDCQGGSAKPMGNTIIIKIGGEWSEGTPRLCDLQVHGREILASAERCGHPPTLYGLRVDSVDFSSASSTAVYACDLEFYHQSGSGQVNCNENGTWSFPATTCSNEDNILIDKGELYVDRDPPTCPDDSVIFEFLNTSTYELSSVTISFNNSETSNFKVEVAVIDIMQNSSRECAVYESSSTSAAPTPSPLTLYCEKRPLGQFLHLQFNNSIPGSLEVRATGRRYTGALECMLTKEGWDYKGRVNMTVSGLACRRWDSVSSATAIPEEKFSAGAPENYCRSPEGSESVTGTVVRPWCYTTDSNVKWEYCPVGLCSGGCVEDSSDIQYTGMIDVTASGKSCRSWKLDAVPFQMPTTFPDRGRDHNHCRNPGESMTKPWCYTRVHPLEAEVCMISKCPTSPPAVTTGEVFFNRPNNVVANIVECFFWNTEATQPWVVQRWTQDIGVDSIFTHLCNDNRSVTFWCSENKLTSINWTYGNMACDTTTTVTSTSSTTSSALITDISTGDTTQSTTNTATTATTTDTTTGTSTSSTTPSALITDISTVYDISTGDTTQSTTNTYDTFSTHN
ncbi:uncharacterized protein LOC124272332 [Haliotis rubra]|uniref:uncharacterized protein LOC124272332 n=1 Tax=Haliotis rubra TaxID=36100 RepID=UPI001EE561BF|nr:uncharacterized protein LOC124272332 [Haliotis rubra]